MHLLTCQARKLCFRSIFTLEAESCLNGVISLSGVIRWVCIYRTYIQQIWLVVLNWICEGMCMHTLYTYCAIRKLCIPCSDVRHSEKSTHSLPASCWVYCCPFGKHVHERVFPFQTSCGVLVSAIMSAHLNQHQTYCWYAQWALLLLVLAIK